MSKSTNGNGQKRAILYARVSTDDQAEHGYSLPTQLDALRKYAGEHGLAVAGEITDDYTGAKLDRPGLDRLRAMIDRREAEAVICYSVDRLTRNPGHAWELSETWHRAGIELHFCNRGQSENTPEGTMTYGFESLFAYYYRAKTMEATKRGRLAKAQAGKWVGSGFAPYGYRKVGIGVNTALEICDSEAETVRRIFDLYTGRGGQPPMALQAIAELLTREGVPLPGRGKKGRGRGWWATTIKRMIIDRRAYIGEFEYSGHVFSNPELAIVDGATFAAAASSRDRNKARSRQNRKKHDYLLVGYVRCACNANLQGYTPTRKPGRAEQSYYRCARRAAYQYMTDCQEKYLRTDKADELVWRWVMELITDPAKRAEGLRLLAARRKEEIEPKQKRLALLKAGIQAAGRTVDQLAADYRQAVRDRKPRMAQSFKQQMEFEQESLNALSDEKAKLEVEINQREFTKAQIGIVNRMAAGLQSRLALNPTCQQKQELFDILELRVKLRHDETGRWLDATCGLVADPKSLPLDSVLTDYHSCRRTLRDSSYMVTFSASLPLDGQPAGSLADSLFYRAKRGDIVVK